MAKQCPQVEKITEIPLNAYSWANLTPSVVSQNHLYTIRSTNYSMKRKFLISASQNLVLTTDYNLKRQEGAPCYTLSSNSLLLHNTKMQVVSLLQPLPFEPKTYFGCNGNEWLGIGPKFWLHLMLHYQWNILAEYGKTFISLEISKYLLKK